ncbi:flagellar motor switch protein FliM [Oceanicola sp. S124]|uniref:flagellar motor switch protein FliM n=1 Tax=Oceanicola sp. S124 TaxID=1042378 RepID=UPI0002559C75|nr:FliM/FliN family flagellar motor C-terminal domain-containing protein [Oceanicola sp. S124]
MATSESNAVLRKKASAARETYQARAMSPDKALRLALAKSADELLELPLVVLSCQYDFLTAEDLAEQLSDEALLILLDGAQRIPGALMLDLASTSALVEQNTMGRVSPLAPEARATTSTDAALVGPLIDDVFLRVAMMLEGDRSAGWMTGFTFGVRIENVRLLTLALETPDFHVFRLHVEYGNTRQGEMLIALPDRSHLPALEQEGEAAGGGATVGDAVMAAPATIEAVLKRVTMPFAKIRGLKVGDVIEIPREALEQTRLETPGEKGRPTCLGRVRLGQMNGFRAVRLTMAELAEARAAVEASGEGARPGAASGGGAPLSLDFGADEGEMTADPEMAMPDLPDLSASEGAMMGDLPDLGAGDDDFPAMGELPDLPDLSDLPELTSEGEESEGDGGFPMMSMADLPDLED